MSYTAPQWKKDEIVRLAGELKTIKEIRQAVSVGWETVHRHLFSATTMQGTPTWRAKSTCSRVCGIGPSVAATTRIAPSICAAPVIMFLM